MIWQLAQQMKAAKRPRILKLGEQRRDFVCVEDVLQANLLALKSKTSGVFNAGSGYAGSFNEVISGLNKSMGTTLEARRYFDNPTTSRKTFTDAGRHHRHQKSPRLRPRPIIWRRRDRLLPQRNRSLVMIGPGAERDVLHKPPASAGGYHCSGVFRKRVHTRNFSLTCSWIPALRLPSALLAPALLHPPPRKIAGRPPSG